MLRVLEIELNWKGHVGSLVMESQNKQINSNVFITALIR